MRNISSWAIRNPVFPLVLFAALALLGMVTFLRMDVNNNPDISFPAASVTVSQPGAAPSELETQVTQRVEAAIRGINGVDEIQSTARGLAISKVPRPRPLQTISRASSCRSRSIGRIEIAPLSAAPVTVCGLPFAPSIWTTRGAMARPASNKGPTGVSSEDRSMPGSSDSGAAMRRSPSFRP